MARGLREALSAAVEVGQAEALQDERGSVPTGLVRDGSD
jgi:hypothetical protein